MNHDKGFLFGVVFCVLCCAVLCVVVSVRREAGKRHVGGRNVERERERAWGEDRFVPRSH
jgi:hypothetical protein